MALLPGRVYAYYTPAAGLLAQAASDEPSRPGARAAPEGTQRFEMFAIDALHAVSSFPAEWSLKDPNAESGEPAPPTVVDVPHAGQTADVLSCTMGNWTGVPDSYAYQWQADGIDVAGAANSNLTVTAADIGKSMACNVTASNALGSELSLSNAVVVVDPAGAGTMSTTSGASTSRHSRSR